MTETDICNLALDRIGEPAISDFAENSPNAITCRRHYEAVRDSLLRSHPWNFAAGRAQLTADLTAPEFGYSYSYQLPVDCLRELTLNGVEAKKCEASYTIEGRKLLTDASEARITYVKKVEDPNDFDSLFSDVLAFRLAAAIAVSVTGSESKRDGMEQMAALRLNDASFVDANETSPRVLSPLRAGRRSRSNDFRDYGNAPDAGVDLDNGEDGANGWTPTFAVVSDGDRRVLWVTGWSGGAGTEPDAGYLGASGIVATAGTAVDIRGIQGEIGPFGTNLHIGLTAPVDPEGFPLWWKSDIGLLMIWYDDGTSEQWVSAVGAGPVGPSAYASYLATTSDDPVLSEADWVSSLGGGGAWGSIVGTLSAQTDLQAALDGKAASLGSDDNYVTDAEKVVIGNTSGTNSGNVTLAGSLDYITLSGQAITRNAIDLTTDVTGALPAANGGTGQTSLAAVDAADLGSGAATDNYVLTADGAGGAAWEAAASPFDPASPGAIGGTTPNAGAFTSLTVTPAANSSAFTSTGFSLTGSNAQSFFGVTGTLNTTGAPTLFDFNITHTAADAQAKFLNYRDGSTNKFFVLSNGHVFTNRLYLRYDPATSYGDRWFEWNGAVLAFNGPFQVSADIELISGIHFGGYGGGSANQNYQGYIGAPSDDTYQFGNDHATSGTTQFLKGMNVTTGTGGNLIAKGGTGSVANGLFGFGTHSAIGAETVTGYINIVDEGGTVRKVAIVS